MEISRDAGQTYWTSSNHAQKEEILTKAENTRMFPHGVALFIAHVSVVVRRHTASRGTRVCDHIALEYHVEDTVITGVFNEIVVPSCQQT